MTGRTECTATGRGTILDQTISLDETPLSAGCGRASASTTTGSGGCAVTGDLASSGARRSDTGSASRRCLPTACGRRVPTGRGRRCTSRNPLLFGMELEWKRCSATRTPPSQERSYPDVPTTGSAARPMTEVSEPFQKLVCGHTKVVAIECWGMSRRH